MSDPYSKDGQIFTFGVHGTNNDPSNVREVSRRISAAVGETTSGANLWDNGFDWRARTQSYKYNDEYGMEREARVPVAGTAYTMNSTQDREIASQRLASHVLQQVDNAIANNKLDRDKPLTINLVGFSHGGNVAILASDEISEGLKRRGIESAIHLTTLSTPAYDWGKESPTHARDLVKADGVKFAHTHISTPGDGVIRAAVGNSNYDNDVTSNWNFTKAPFGLNGVANHGAVQDVPAMMDTAGDIMKRRFNGLAPAQLRSDAGDDTRIASVTSGTPASNLDWKTFDTNPMLMQASDALHRAAPDVPKENQNPSVVAGVAGVAAENNFATIKDVAFSQNGQTAFVTDRDKADPSARVATMDMALGHRQTAEVMQQYKTALDTAQQGTQIAADVPEPQRKQGGPTMA